MSEQNVVRTKEECHGQVPPIENLMDDLRHFALYADLSDVDLSDVYTQEINRIYQNLNIALRLEKKL